MCENNSYSRITFPSFTPANRLPPGECRNIDDLFGTLFSRRNSKSRPSDPTSISPSANTSHAVPTTTLGNEGGFPWNFIGSAWLVEQGKVTRRPKEKSSSPL